MPVTPGNNTANFAICADWDGQDGNVTTVGTNGGPSAYGTYDQTGNIGQWQNDYDGILTNGAMRGGSWFDTNPASLSRSQAVGNPSNKSQLVGLRIASSYSSPNPYNFSNFVTVEDINNVGNDADNFGGVGRGIVGYPYAIGKYLVTNSEYIEFLNAVAVTDTYALYNTGMTNARGGIIRSGSSGSYTYAVKTNYGNKPVNYVSWFDCARYCNWLHNGKPTGLQNNSTTEDGAYTLNGLITGDTVAKNDASAKYHIPTENEWYKAAYYRVAEQMPVIGSMLLRAIVIQLALVLIVQEMVLLLFLRQHPQ